LNILLLGPQGSGKGTQAKRISADYGIPQIATGDMFRSAIASKTELGQKVAPILAAGELVPDDLTIALIRERLSQPDTMQGFVLDGFPRTLPQAEALDGILSESDRGITVVLDFQLSEELAEQRLLKRALEQGRDDDTPEIIHRRMETMRIPETLVELYRARGLLVGIHAERSIEEVFAEVQSVLQAAAAR
jgi:adenylate kinase